MSKYSPIGMFLLRDYKNDIPLIYTIFSKGNYEHEHLNLSKPGVPSENSSGSKIVKLENVLKLKIYLKNL